jgi:hypothetical protein
MRIPLTSAGIENPTGKMAIGQISEALFLLLIPVFLFVTALKNNFSRYVSMGNSLRFVRLEMVVI